MIIKKSYFTVGSPVTSDQASLQIFGLGNVFNLYPRPKIWSLIRGYCRPNKEPFLATRNIFNMINYIFTSF